MEAAMNARTNLSTAVPRETATAKPRFWSTYALTYAIGSVWLAVEILLIGTQKPYSFTGFYIASFMLPPFLITAQLLLVDRRGETRTLGGRVLAVTIVAGLASVLSTVVLTPLLILMFRERVGFSLVATGTVAWASLIVVASPVLPELVRALREGRPAHAATLAAGLAVVAVELLLAFNPAGALARSLHRDQGAFLMVTASWLLPVFAASVGWIRRLDTD